MLSTCSVSNYCMTTRLADNGAGLEARLNAMVN